MSAEKKIFVTIYGVVYEEAPFDDITEAFKALREDGYEPSEKFIKYFEGVEGTYVPPSTPESVCFPK